jgi:hypothetical protein
MYATRKPHNSACSILQKRRRWWATSSKTVRQAQSTKISIPIDIPGFT